MAAGYIDKVYIVEPHPDDALGSALALCIQKELKTVICTVADSERNIDLSKHKKGSKYIDGHIKFKLPDLDWNLREGMDSSYIENVRIYREKYGEGNLGRLRDSLSGLVGAVCKEDAHLAFPLGIMHPMHVLVSSLIAEIAAEKQVPKGKLWIYVDHPYDLHSLGSTLLRQNVAYLEGVLGVPLVRHDAVTVNQAAGGELVRRFYGDCAHAEFANAFTRTFCSFYFLGNPSKKQKELAGLQKINVLVVAAQGFPYLKGGGLANTVYGLAKTEQNFVNDVRILLPCGVDEGTSYGELLDMRMVSWVSPKKEELDIKVETRRYQGCIYYLIKVPGFQQSSEDPVWYVRFGGILLEKIIPGLGFSPDILHCHDWQSAAVPFLLKTKYARDSFYRNIKTLYTIHFYGYQGVCKKEEFVRELAMEESETLYQHLRKIQYLTSEAQEMGTVDKPILVSLMNAGIRFADQVSTVSPNYAKELNSYPAFKKIKPVKGIRNGILYDMYDPAADVHLSRNYSLDGCHQGKRQNKEALQKLLGWEMNGEIPMLCVVSRLDRVKGLESILSVLSRLLQHPVQMVIMGDERGKACYRSRLEELEAEYPAQLKYCPFQEEMETMVYAASDILFMPSLSEGCGTSQMIAMHYGVVPVVSCVSGLQDSVTALADEKMHKGVGYFCYPDDFWMLYEVFLKVLEDFQNKSVWDYMVWKCMVTDFSWECQVKKYVQLYHTLLRDNKNRKGRGIGSKRLSRRRNSVKKSKYRRNPSRDMLK